jgi:hypothetical protein
MHRIFQVLLCFPSTSGWCIAGLAAEVYAPRRQLIISTQVRIVMTQQARPTRMHRCFWSSGVLVCSWPGGRAVHTPPPAHHIDTGQKCSINQLHVFLERGGNHKRGFIVKPPVVGTQPAGQKADEQGPDTAKLVWTDYFGVLVCLCIAGLAAEL